MAERFPEQPVLAVNGMERAVPPLGPATTLAEAAVLFGDAAVDLLPVMEGERLVGALSLRDLAMGCCGSGVEPTTATVGTVMDVEPLRLSAQTGAAEALDTMHARGAAAALIVRGRDELAGVVSIHGLHRLLRSPPEGPTPEYVRRVRGEQP